ncbi:MAG: sel1 repeat family protein [Magnetococcus sp. DMHC-8]
MMRTAPVVVCGLAALLIGQAVIGQAAGGGMDGLHHLAEQGNVQAQRRLGQMYHDGQGVQRDYAQSMHWFRLAAAQGDAEAQNGVGTLYDNGKGVARDYQEAARWFRLAADRGHVLARRNLGWMYEKGQGFAQDYVMAYKWQYLAEMARLARQGDGSQEGVDRCRLCNALARKMTADQVARAKELARHWQPGDP